MPGSESPEINDPASERAQTSDIATSIEADFRMLVATLAQQIELQEDPDSEVLATLWNAKIAAERGLRLSERLVKVINDNEDKP